MKYFRYEHLGSRIDIYPLVCWHIGAKQCAHKFIDRVIAEIKGNPNARWLYMGDGGECWDGQTELLTDHGWCKSRDYNGSAPIAQWTPDNDNDGVGRIEFVVPSAFIRKPFERLYRHQNTHIDLAVTADHRCLVQSKKGKLRVVRGKEYGNTQLRQLHGGIYDGPGISLTDSEIRLLVAFQADGTFTEGKRAAFVFKKQRKVERLKKILGGCGLEYRESAKHEGRTRISFEIPSFFNSIFPARAKVFGPWVLDMSQAQLSVFVDELPMWDGCSKLNSRFTTTLRQNADWAQIAVALTAKRARVRTRQLPRPNSKPEHILHVTDTNYSMSSDTTTTVLESPPDSSDPHVYCVSVPSTYVLIRRNGKVHVTGQCVTRTSKGNIYEQLMSPGAQLRTVADLLAPIKEKAIGGIRGNHGNRIDKDSGLGWDETLCSRIGIPYLGVSCFGDIILKTNASGCRATFSLFAHHGSASAITDGGKVNAGFKPGQFIDADVVLTAHTHACGKLFPRHRAITNGAMRRIDWRVQNFFVCGSAYDSRSGYAEEKIYNPILPEHLVISAEAKRTRANGERRLEIEYNHRHIHGFARDSANREDLLKWGDAA